MHANRLCGDAGVRFKGVCADTIESSNGRASVAPAPRRNVLRARCFFEMKFISAISSIDSFSRDGRLYYQFHFRYRFVGLGCLDPCLKWRTRHDAEDER